VGDVNNASGSEPMLRERGVVVDILEDAEGIALYAKYKQEKPELELEDWKGVAALQQKKML
jgi:cytosine deaminase